MAGSSWLQSFLSPAVRRCFPSQYIKPLTEHLRRHGLLGGGLMMKVLVEEEQDDNELKTSTSFPCLSEVEDIIGYKFNNQLLLQEAFTHVSCNKNLSYERLEYVGDSVLNLLISKQQFFVYPNLQPGILSHLRAANIDTEKLARAAVKHKLHRYLQHNHPALSKQIGAFMSDLSRFPLHSHGLIDAPKVLADIVESTIGATFIDSNSSMDITWKVAKTLLQPMITRETLQDHPMKKLHETCQKRGMKIRLQDLWVKEGAYQIIVDGHLKGRGECRAKKEIALNRAAHNAYNQIVRNLGS
ncbi:ribonuclease 3-like protein 3 isoform X2 [Impatiens glandulifera]|uniref:ribonuclease 3-like protein 3 isoform X2 n=1 Tax=Impatiens glandulifera TaxID=253017 RepID=UPI001FB0E7AE|nr:ribonuclease 3-like protein 3 isoform X2 [Impatiens glandulifera]